LENLNDSYNGTNCGDIGLSDSEGRDRVYAVTMAVGDYLVAWLQPNNWDAVLYLSTSCGPPLDLSSGACPVGWNRSSSYGDNERLDYVATSDGTVYLVVDQDNGTSVTPRDYTLDVTVGAGTVHPTSAGDVVVTEIMPDAGSNDCEWIELYNANGSPLDLNGSRIYYRDNKSFDIDYPLILRPGEYMVVGRTADTSSNCGLDWMSWSDGGFDLDAGIVHSYVSLRWDPSGSDTLIDEVDYPGTWSTSKHAMYLCTNHNNDTDNDDTANNWQEDDSDQYTTNYYGTPADESYETDGNPSTCN